MMTKVVINDCYGGFGLSDLAQERLRELGWQPEDEFNIERDDPRLIQVVEELGTLASARFASLTVIEIPDDADWYVDEYDGAETVRDGRTWP